MKSTVKVGVEVVELKFELKLELELELKLDLVRVEVKKDLCLFDTYQGPQSDGDGTLNVI